MAALRDIVPVYYRAVHVPPKVFLDSFKKEIEVLLREVCWHNRSNYQYV